MNITVTFTDTGDTNIPEGAALAIEDVGNYQVNSPNEIEQISCDESGCKGCDAAHRRLTGAGSLTLEASGPKRALWKVPEVTG